MHANPFTDKSLCRSSGGKLLTDQYSGAFMNGIKQSVLLAGLLGVAVALVTGSSSAPHSFSARVITAHVTNQQNIDSRGDFYQPARSLAFNDDFGG